MSGSKLLVDTNIVLYFLKGHKNVAHFFADYEVCISFITELELLSFPTISNSDEQTIRSFLSLVHIIDLNHEVKEKAISVRRQSKLKLPDAIIAATAISFDIPLLTADVAFSSVNDSRILLFEM